MIWRPFWAIALCLAAALVALGSVAGQPGEDAAIHWERLSREWRETNAPPGLIKVAKCFKAKDLNRHRANEFIEYSRTGVAENRVMSF